MQWDKKLLIAAAAVCRVSNEKRVFAACDDHSLLCLFLFFFFPMKISKRYHQMRIKILGDCYYCICGAPVERPDHAVLCVYMGLAMIDAIK